MRFVAHDFLIGSPILIDRAAQTLTLYSKNINGMICNLRMPDCIAVDAKKKRLLIQCTRGNYSPRTRKAVDSYIFAYLLTPEEREKCVWKPYEPTDTKIVETDSFHEAIKAICAFAYDYEHDGKGGTTGDKVSFLQYCEDFLRENPSPPIPTPKERGGEAR